MTKKERQVEKAEDILESLRRYVYDLKKDRTSWRDKGVAIELSEALRMTLEEDTDQ